VPQLLFPVLDEVRYEVFQGPWGMDLGSSCSEEIHSKNCILISENRLAISIYLRKYALKYF
jgi:hypothetical protein